jgi:cell division transport system ATP-binding protein
MFTLPAARRPVIRFERVCKRYPNGTEALRNVDLDVSPGNFVFLVGPSGAGKSSMLRLLIREELATGGAVYVHGLDLARLRRRLLPRLRRTIGLVFQDFKLLPRLTVDENVAFALRVAGHSSRAIRRRVCEVVDVVGLSHKLDAYPSELSGGEQQRVGVARALVHDPRLIVADEPTGNLDPATAWEIMQLFLHINSAGATVVVATHNRDIVDRMRRRVVAIEHGQIVRDEVTGTYHEDLAASCLRA